MTARKRARATAPKKAAAAAATAPDAPASEAALGGPVEDSCRRCGLQTRIHPLDFHLCDSCRAEGWRSDTAGQKLRVELDADGNDAGVKVVNAW